MLFKVGDKVKIRNDLIGGSELSGVFIVKEMCDYGGVVTKILDILYDDFWGKEVIRLENNPHWEWPEEALTPFPLKRREKKMKSYKNYEQIHIGSSDISSLILAGGAAFRMD